MPSWIDIGGLVLPFWCLTALSKIVLIPAVWTYPMFSRFSFITQKYNMSMKKQSISSIIFSSHYLQGSRTMLMAPEAPIQADSDSEIQINLAQQSPDSSYAYTTDDSISGKVSIAVGHDVDFDDIDIAFEGTSKISIQSPYFPNEENPQQTFLKLRQPIKEASYPAPRVLKPGYTYRFSFAFVVPARLLPPVCSHEKSNHHIEQSHTLLPPTLGDHPELASNGKCRPDDMCPDMCGISYRICVSVLKKRPNGDDGTPYNAVLSNCKKVRVIPTVEEEPPMSVSGVDSGYCMSKEKKVRRAFLHNTLGRLVVCAVQPRPIQFFVPNFKSNESAGTAVTLNLRFEPVGEEQPPQLGTVRSGIRVFTFYGTKPWTDYPSPGFEKCLALLGYEVHAKTITCPTISIANSQWVKHPTYYTTSVVVPIPLPTDKVFVPTFHSCWISRIYSLDLSVSYHAPNVNIMTSTASLKIPIQVANERNNVAPEYPLQEENTNGPPPAYSDC